ncbi:hypothetical protein MHBO_003014 [Bonamia ostreae]|uniref:Uncharacterized protein n=1 Tax=Bonamia ostreae TaxID=126728 RepID=A0ABV2AP96_9EUKA
MFPYQNPSCFSSTTNNRLSPKESYLFSQLILLISQIDPKNDEMNNKLYVGFFNGSKSFLRNKSFAEHGKTFNQIAISVANYAAKVIILDKMDHRTALFTFIYFKHELKKILDKFEGSLENYLNFKKMATKFVGKWIREISSFYSDGILSVKKRLNVWTEIIDKDVENNCLLDRKTFVESLLRFYRDFCVDLYSKKKKPENRKNFGFYSKFERNLLKI